MIRFCVLSLSVLCVTMPLAACGVKPATLQAPASAPQPDTFPQTYPAPETDPAPTYRNRTPAPRPANASQAGSGLQF